MFDCEESDLENNRQGQGSRNLLTYRLHLRMRTRSADAGHGTSDGSSWNGNRVRHRQSRDAQTHSMPKMPETIRTRCTVKFTNKLSLAQCMAAVPVFLLFGVM